MKQDTTAQQPPEISADKLGALFGVQKPAPSSGGLPNPAAMPKMVGSNNKHVEISNSSSQMMKNKVNGLFAKPKRNMMMVEKDFKEDDEYG